MKTKKTQISFLICTIFSLNIYSQVDPIDYFGQTSPGVTAVKFAPGIISQDNRSEGNISFSPDGKKCLFHVIDVTNWQWGDIYYSENINGNWNTPSRADFLETSNYFDIQPSFSPDGKTLYYSSLNPYRGYIKGGIYVNLWKVEYDSEGWKTPEKLNSVINSLNNDETFPSFTLDGTLYFQKDQTGFLWSSKLEVGEFKEIKKLEKPINSTAGYYHPYVTPDGSYMILLSNRNEGYGLSDLYISYNRGEDKWTNPKNLGDKINTEAGEGGPTVSPDGKYLFFGRSNDIYWVELADIVDSLKTSNYAPFVKNEIPNQTDTIGKHFSYTIPDTIFIDDDGNETLTLTVKLTNGKDLPDSLDFDSEKRIIFGTLKEAKTYNIKVTATDTIGESVSDIFRLTVKENSVGINETFTNNNIIVYPNPAHNKIFIESTNFEISNSHYKIIGITGATLQEGYLSSNSIDISELKTGTYLLQLKTKAEVITRKIVVE